MKRWLILVSVFLVVIYASSLTCDALTVSPEMELLAGVLAQTTWIENLGPSGSGNEYFRALQEFFATYKDHPAVIQAQNFTNKGFTFDAPAAFVCHLGPLPDLELLYEYSSYLISRAGGRERLEDFRLALKDLAYKSDFLVFFASWDGYLEASLENSRADFRQELLENWLEDFFGWSASEFHLLMAPSMFPGGGYGATVTDSQGNSIAFQIIREQGCSQTVPEFPSGVSLENLTIHELGHFFVNPSLEAYSTRARKLSGLFWPVHTTMAKQAYPTVRLFLNEQVIRAIEVISAQDLFEPEMAELILANHEERGFYLTRFVVEKLGHYQANRDLYPTFRDFVPYLYDQLEAYQKEQSTSLERFLGLFTR